MDGMEDYRKRLPWSGRAAVGELPLVAVNLRGRHHRHRLTDVRRRHDDAG